MIKVRQRPWWLIVDWPLLFFAFIIAVIGLIFIYSTTHTVAYPYSLFFKKQLFGTVTGIMIFFLFAHIDYRMLINAGRIGYFLVLFLLIITLIKGNAVMGGRRWLSGFFFKIQPSELTKLLFPAYFSHYMMSFDETADFYFFIPVITVLAISFFLIAAQPDLGTALILGFSGFLLLWFAYVPRIFFITLFVCIMISSPIAWYLLKPYQKKRVAVFFGTQESEKDRYQLEQSIIAIGSGGMSGKGLFAGTQNRFHFLPESRTDFIFAVLCEETGFVGALCLLLLYLLLLMRAWYLLFLVPRFYAQLCALGLLLPIMFSMVVNIGMVMGMLPIVGIPLPFMSYGIANLWVSWASLGWFQSIIRSCKE